MKKAIRTALTAASTASGAASNFMEEETGNMKKAILCIALTAALSTSAFALEVPSETVVQNLNGSQQVIKTYTLPPEATHRN